MGDITEHFDRKEFKCPCCGKSEISTDFVKRLEDVFTYLKKCEHGCKYIIITSGYRCPSNSAAVGGMKTDMHTKGRAADWYCIGEDGYKYKSKELAAVCEVHGFGGIGVNLNDDNEGICVHCDDRENGGYSNSHWYGDEQTNANYSSFMAYLPAAKIINKHKISVFYDGKKISESEV